MTTQQQVSTLYTGDDIKHCIAFFTEWDINI